VTATQLTNAAIAALQAGNKIEAIKITRETAGLGLKEAKDLVDAYVAGNPALQAQLQATQSSAARSLLSWVLMMILAIAAIVYFWPRG